MCDASSCCLFFLILAHFELFWKLAVHSRYQCIVYFNFQHRSWYDYLFPGSQWAESCFGSYINATWSEVDHHSPPRFTTFRIFLRDSVIIYCRRNGLKLKSLSYYSSLSFTMVCNVIYPSNVADIRLFVAWQERQEAKEERRHGSRLSR